MSLGASSGSVASNLGSTASEGQRTTSFVGIDPTTRASLPYSGNRTGDRCSHCGGKKSSKRCRYCTAVEKSMPPGWSLMGVSQGAGEAYGSGDRSGSFLGKGHKKGTPQHAAWLEKFRAKRGTPQKKAAMAEERQSPARLAEHGHLPKGERQNIAKQSPKISFEEGIHAIAHGASKLHTMSPKTQQHFKQVRDWFWDRVDNHKGSEESFKFQSHHLAPHHLAVLEFATRGIPNRTAQGANIKFKSAIAAQKSLGKALIWFEYTLHRLTA